ncbi:MAG: hypothetical protein ACR2PF_10345 [Rhizobiaceae bacterium]
MMMVLRCILSSVLSCLLLISAALAADSHSGRYYPEPASSEVYTSPFPRLPNAGKRTRVGFTVGLNARQLKRGYAPTYHMFAKGSEAEKLIIVATGDGRYDTLYRIRGLLAAMTAEARLSPLFRQLATPENVNFFDLVRMTGFSQITVSDGRAFAHRINLE